VRILLDENMPESVRSALREIGHEADSVVSLLLKGLDNGTLYREVARSYDLCFTRDRGFVDMVRSLEQPSPVKVLRVTLSQQPARRFTFAFMQAFTSTDWSAPFVEAAEALLRRNG
jgi:predicted nuclease of predicted toxin-antitoxin system